MVENATLAAACQSWAKSASTGDCPASVGVVFPIRHDLVHAPAEQVGAYRSLEVVDGGVDLGVGRSPLEAAGRIGHIPVERGDGDVEQVRHQEEDLIRPAWRRG